MFMPQHNQTKKQKHPLNKANSFVGGFNGVEAFACGQLGLPVGLGSPTVCSTRRVEYVCVQEEEEEDQLQCNINVDITPQGSDKAH